MRLAPKGSMNLGGSLMNGRGMPLSPYPLPIPSSWGEGAMLFTEEKVGLLPRPVRNPPSRRRYGVAGERGEGKGRGASHKKSSSILHPPSSIFYLRPPSSALTDLTSPH